MSINAGFKGEEFRRISFDSYSEDSPYSTGLLSNIRNQVCFLDKNRGAKCSVGFIGRSFENDSITHVRPIVSSGRWGAFLVVPYWIQPALEQVDLDILFRTGFGALQNPDNPDFSTLNSEVQIRAYFTGRNGGKFNAKRFLSNASGDDTFWTCQRITVAVDSRGIDFPVRDVLVVEVNSDPTDGRTSGVYQVLSSRSSDDLLSIIDGSGLIDDLFPDDNVAASPEFDSMWLNSYKLSDLGGNRITFHDGVALLPGDQGVVFPFVTPQGSTSIFANVHLSYFQVANVDISERYRKEISRIDDHEIASRQDATATGVGALAVAANEISARYDLVCGRLGDNTTQGPAISRKDNHYGLRDFWANPFAKGTNLRTSLAGGSTNFASPSFIANMVLFGSHDIFEDITPVDFNVDGSNSAFDEMTKFSIDGLGYMQVEIIQDGAVVGVGEVDRTLIKFWPSFLSDASHTLLQTHMAERAITDGVAVTFRNGIYDIDRGNGTDAFIFGEMAVEFEVDSTFDRSCEFGIRVTFGLSQDQDTFPRWAPDSIYSNGDYVAISGPHDIVAFPGTILPPPFPSGIGWAEYDSRLNAETVIELATPHVAQVGDRLVVSGGPNADQNGVWTVSDILSATRLGMVPELRNLSWPNLRPGGRVSVERSQLDFNALRVDCAGFALWAKAS